MSEQITYEIKMNIGVLKINENSGWRRELNIVSWNGSQPKFDIREWSPDHKKMGRGITFAQEEMQQIVDLYRDYKFMRQ